MNVFTSYEDALLWEAVCDDNREAFDIFIKRYWKTLYNDAYKRVQSFDVCQDLVQDVFVNIWQKRHSLKIDNHRAYLRTAIRYRVFRYFSREENNTADFLEPFEDILDNSMWSDMHINVAELRKLINAWIDTLPPKSKKIFSLYLENNLSTKEIAEELQISQKTVQNQLGRSMKHLRSKLSGAYSVISLFF